MELNANLVICFNICSVLCFVYVLSVYFEFSQQYIRNTFGLNHKQIIELDLIGFCKAQTYIFFHANLNHLLVNLLVFIWAVFVIDRYNKGKKWIVSYLLIIYIMSLLYHLSFYFLITKMFKVKPETSGIGFSGVAYGFVFVACVFNLFNILNPNNIKVNFVAIIEWFFEFLNVSVFVVVGKLVVSYFVFLNSILSGAVNAKSIISGDMMHLSGILGGFLVLNLVVFSKKNSVN